MWNLCPHNSFKTMLAIFRNLQTIKRCNKRLFWIWMKWERTYHGIAAWVWVSLAKGPPSPGTRNKSRPPLRYPHLSPSIYLQLLFHHNLTSPGLLYTNENPSIRRFVPVWTLMWFPTRPIGLLLFQRASAALIATLSNCSSSQNKLIHVKTRKHYVLKYYEC